MISRKLLVLAITVFMLVSAIPVFSEIINSPDQHPSVVATPDITNSTQMNYVSHSLDIQQNASYPGFHQFASTGSRTGVSFFSPETDTLFISATSAHSSNLGPGRHIDVVDIQNWTVISWFEAPVQPYPGALNIYTWITGMAFDPSNNMLYVAVYEFINPPSQTVGQSYLYELYASNGTVFDSLKFDNSVINGMAYNEEGNSLYLTVSIVPTGNTIFTPSSSEIIAVDPANIETQKFTSVGFSPAVPVYDNYNNRLYVPDFTLGGIDIVNVTDYSVTKVKLSNFSDFPSYITYSRSSLYVTGFLSSKVMTYNSSNLSPEGNLTLQQNLTEIGGITYDNSNNLLYMSEGDVLAVNVFTGAIQHFPIGGGVGPLSFDALNGAILAGVNGAPGVAEISLGSQSTVRFSESGVLGNQQWEVTVNGITYVTTNSTLEVNVTGNYIDYEFNCNYYLGVSPQGIINASTQDTASVMFVSVFFIVIPPILAGSLISVYAIRRYRKK